MLGLERAIGSAATCLECSACALDCTTGASTVEAGIGCAAAIINGWLTGSEPSCDSGQSIRREYGGEREAVFWRRLMNAVHRTYPLRDVALYNGMTLLHFGIATFGLVIAFDRWPLLAWVLGIAYLVIALGQMYVVMPLVVCPACVYATMPGSRCVSGMNLIVTRLGLTAPAEEFEARRTRGILSHNKLYMGSLIAPLPLLAVGLVLDFSPLALAALLAVAGLLAFRILAIFKRTACPHCAMKGRCPNARAMGIV